MFHLLHHQLHLLQLRTVEWSICHLVIISSSTSLHQLLVPIGIITTKVVILCLTFFSSRHHKIKRITTRTKATTLLAPKVIMMIMGSYGRWRWICKKIAAAWKMMIIMGAWLQTWRMIWDLNWITAWFSYEKYAYIVLEIKHSLSLYESTPFVDCDLLFVRCLALRDKLFMFRLIEYMLEDCVCVYYINTLVFNVLFFLEDINKHYYSTSICTN